MIRSKIKVTPDTIEVINRLDGILTLLATIWVNSGDSDAERDLRRVDIARLFNKIGVQGELGAAALSVTKGSYYNLVMRAKRRRR